jgi:hypothetical protein
MQALDWARAAQERRRALVDAAQGDLGGTRQLVYKLGKNNQLTVRHSRVAVYPFIKQGHRNAQLCSTFFPPDSSYHLAQEQLLVRFSQRRGQSATESRKWGPG